jgi:hypothetical protein
MWTSFQLISRSFSLGTFRTPVVRKICYTTFS